MVAVRAVAGGFTGRKGAEKRVKDLRVALVEAADPVAALAAVQTSPPGASEFVVLGPQAVEGTCFAFSHLEM